MIAKGKTYALLHVGNDVLHLGDGLARELVVFRRRHGGQLNFLVLQLELEALDGKLHFLDSLVTQALVQLLALGVGAVFAGGGDGSELKSKGKLEVRLGNDLRLLRVEAELVLEGEATVFDGVEVSASVLAAIEKDRWMVGMVYLSFSREISERASWVSARRSLMCLTAGESSC